MVLNVNAITADFDGNGFVDGGDLAIWQSGYNTNATADADGDGDTDGRDYLAWQRQLGSGINPASGAISVPEPSAIMLAFVGTMACVTCLHCRQR